MAKKKMERVARFSLAAITLGIGLGLAGCQTNRSDNIVVEENETTPNEARRVPSQAYQPEPLNTADEPAPAPRMTGTCRPVAPGPDFGISSLAFPTGDADTSAIMLHQVMPLQVRRGAPFEMEYQVCNLTDGTLQNVMVMLESVDNLRIISSDPEARTSGGNTTMSIGDLAPRSTRIITVVAEADRIGMSTNCISVAYNNVLCAATEVVEPSIELAKTATPRVLLCEPITLTYRVSNTGTGPAENVTITDTLPRGLQVNGRNNVNIPVGTLMAGESRDATVTAEAVSTGTFGSRASASSNDLTANSGEPETVVVQPVLEITCESEEFEYLGRNASYTFTIRNTGDGPANNAQLAANFPAGTRFVRATGGGTATAGRATWSMGTLAAGAERSVELVLTSDVLANLRVNAQATAFCADAVSTTCETEIRGIPALLLEVVDVNDPVEIGEQTTYVIRVTNQGSAPGRNIRIVCERPEQQEFISAGGATSASTAGRTISFAPVASLAPKAVAEWTVTVRAAGEGDVRFGVEMTSDTLRSPVIETESTNLYR